MKYPPILLTDIEPSYLLLWNIRMKNKIFIFFAIVTVIIYGNLAWGQDAAVPKIAFEEKIFAAGEVLEGIQVEHIYKVYNKGNAVLKIYKVSPSCSCTVASFDKEIPPGGEGKIKVTFNTRNRWGEHTKYVRVISNDPQKKLEQLVLKAYIKPLIKIIPGSSVTLRGKPGEVKRMELTIMANVDEPLNIIPEKFSLDGKVSYMLEEVEKGKRYKITFENNPDAPGRFKGGLRLKTNYKEKPKIDIRINSRFF